MNIGPIDAGLIYEKRVFHHREIQTRYNNGVKIINYTTEFPNIAFILFPRWGKPKHMGIARKVLVSLLL